MILNKTKSLIFLSSLLPEYSLTWPSGHKGKGPALFLHEKAPPIGFFSTWNFPSSLNKETLWITPYFLSYRHHKHPIYLLQKTNKKKFILYQRPCVQTNQGIHRLPLLKVQLFPKQKTQDSLLLEQKILFPSNSSSYHLSGDAIDCLKRPQYLHSLQKRKFSPKKIIPPWHERLFLWLKKKLDH